MMLGRPQVIVPPVECSVISGGAGCGLAPFLVLALVVAVASETRLR
jgi:hypothetical protein